MDKKQLRQFYLHKRISLNKDQYWVMMDKIVGQLNQFNWLSFSTISIFLPIIENKEPDTFDIIHFFKKNFPHLKIAVPRSNFIDCTLQHLLFTQESILVKNIYQIPEPIYGVNIKPTEIDVIFVPLLIFDLNGYRVGYGKGFYDRFLANCRDNVVKIGLSFFNPIEGINDKNIFDLPLDYCITPEKTYQF